MRRTLAPRASGAQRPAPPGRPPRRAPGVALRRSDLPLGTPQPWDLDVPTSLAGLGLVDEGEPDAPLSVSLAVSEAGGGYFVRGRVGSPSPLALPCDGCGSPVPVSLGGDGAGADAATFQVWLDPGTGGGRDAEGGDADALPWPHRRAAVDLTPVAAAAAVAALPPRRSCGAAECSSRVGVVEAGGSGSGGGAFGRLAGLKARLVQP